MSYLTAAERLRCRRKLTDEDVRNIHRLSAAGRSAAEIARAYGIGAESIRRALRGETYGHLLPAAADMEPAIEDLTRLTPHISDAEIAESARKVMEKMGNDSGSGSSNI